MHILNYLYSADVFGENRPLTETSEKSAKQIIVEISNTDRNVNTPRQTSFKNNLQTRGKIELEYS